MAPHFPSDEEIREQQAEREAQALEQHAAAAEQREQEEALARRSRVEQEENRRESLAIVDEFIMRVKKSATGGSFTLANLEWPESSGASGGATLVLPRWTSPHWTYSYYQPAARKNAAPKRRDGILGLASAPFLWTTSPEIIREQLMQHLLDMPAKRR